MLRFIAGRVVLMLPVLLVISLVSFLIIQAPPGDFIDAYAAQLEERGDYVSEEKLANLRARYGLGQPVAVQYLKWMRGILRGDWGRSLQFNQPVIRLVWQRLPFSILISLISVLLVYLVAIPIGVYSATHQYSPGDYAVTIIGFLGLSIPNFFFAVILLWLYFLATGDAQFGLFSEEFLFEPWSLAKLFDLIKHMWIPAVVIGTAGTCGLIRTMRANLLDELRKPSVMVAKSKGLSRRRVLYKYPFRIALNPVMSTIGWILPTLVSGEILVSLILGLPTIGPLLLNSLLNQDMYLAGSIVFILSILTVIGTLLSDIALAWVDPRIREAV